MQRLRQRWVALIGGALIVTLTVSTAFGADPADAPDDPRGRTIAAFVHALVFGEEDSTSDEPQDEEETVEDEELQEDLEEGSPETDDVSGAAHGACVSAVARDEGAVGGPNDNHGGAVSEAARDTCSDELDPELDEEVPLEEDEPVEAADSHGTCVSEVARDKDAVGGPNDNHGGAVSEAARETCREGADAGAAGVESAESAGGGNGKGRGNGRGGRP